MKNTKIIRFLINSMHKDVWLSYCVSRRIVFRILNCSLPMPEENEGEKKKKEKSWISNVCQNKYSNIKFFPKKNSRNLSQYK